MEPYDWGLEGWDDETESAYARAKREYALRSQRRALTCKACDRAVASLRNDLCWDCTDWMYAGIAEAERFASSFEA